jgi:hypothetical protein
MPTNKPIKGTNCKPVVAQPKVKIKIKSKPLITNSKDKKIETKAKPIIANPKAKKVETKSQPIVTHL